MKPKATSKLLQSEIIYFYMLPQGNFVFEQSFVCNHSKLLPASSKKEARKKVSQLDDEKLHAQRISLFHIYHLDNTSPEKKKSVHTLGNSSRLKHSIPPAPLGLQV